MGTKINNERVRRRRRRYRIWLVLERHRVHRFFFIIKAMILLLSTSFNELVSHRLSSIPWISIDSLPCRPSSSHSSSVSLIRSQSNRINLSHCSANSRTSLLGHLRHRIVVDVGHTLARRILRRIASFVDRSSALFVVSSFRALHATGKQMAMACSMFVTRPCPTDSSSSASSICLSFHVVRGQLE